MSYNIQLYMWKYLTGPTHKAFPKWRMSDVYTVKYVNEADDCIYTLTFNQDEKTCVLESYDGNPLILSKQKEQISIDNLLPQLKQRELLENWKPTWLTYTDYELALLIPNSKRELFQAI
jgi:hypothetical protein